MAVTLKGTQQGIALSPHSDNWDEVMHALEYALRDAEGFFRGGRVIVELAHYTITASELAALRTLLENHELELWAVLTENREAMHVVRSYGIRTRLPSTASNKEPVSTATEANALFVQRTFRSGQSLNYPGHVVIMGDVNPGAEIIAGGDVIVWGKVRGLVHAGALGDERAIVCALDLAPSQLRIAGYISRAPDERRRKAQPEVASIQQDRIIAQPWTARG